MQSSTHSSSTRRKILSGNMPDSCPEIITDWTYIPLTKANEKSKLTQTCSMTWNIFHLSASLHRSFLDHLREVAIIYFNCVLIFEWMSFLPRDVSWEEKYIKTVNTWKGKGFKGKSVSLLEVFILLSSEKCHATYQLSIVQIWGGTFWFF